MSTSSDNFIENDDKDCFFVNIVTSRGSRHAGGAWGEAGPYVEKVCVFQVKFTLLFLLQKNIQHLRFPCSPLPQY